jgi:DNA polymerase-1
MRKSIDEILKDDIISFDCESTGLNTHKDSVIGFSISDGIDSVYIDHMVWHDSALSITTSFSVCVDLLKQLATKKLVMHNANFDCNIILSYFEVDLLPALYVDTMLLAHLYNENTEYGLKPLAQRYLGIASDEQAVLKAEMKALNTKDFYKVSLTTMAKYAAQDAIMTIKLFNYLAPLLSNSQKNLLFDELLPLYKTVVIPMMRKGVKVDLEKLSQDKVNITLDIMKIELQIQQEIKPHLEPFYDWFYNNKYPMKSRGKMTSLAKANPKATLRQLQIVAHGDQEVFNITSRQHLKILFIDILGCTPLSKTDGGAPQLDTDFLDSVANKYEFAASLVTYFKLSKIKGTYIERFLDEQEEGIFYPNYKLHGTSSGRLSSDFQQLPRPFESENGVNPLIYKYTNAIRKYFISRPGHIFVDLDYSSIEPKVFASDAGDQALLNIFLNGDDFYSTISKLVEGTEGSPNKTSDNYIGKINKVARQRAKGFALGLRYGMSDYKLHHELHISQAAAAKLVKSYFDAFPLLTAGMEACKQSIITTGQIENTFGRIRHAPEAVELYNKYGEKAFNALELWKYYNEGDVKKPGYINAKIECKRLTSYVQNAYNFPIQSTAAHILNRASIKVAEYLKDKNASIIGSIHDQLIIECLESDKQEIAKNVQNIMETTTLIKVPLEAEPNFGYNLSESKG